MKPGDIVRLKSGGPDMTVINTRNSSVTGDPMVLVMWFVGRDEHSRDFPPQCLKPADDTLFGDHAGPEPS